MQKNLTFIEEILNGKLHSLGSVVPVFFIYLQVNQLMYKDQTVSMTDRPFVHQFHSECFAFPNIFI